MRTTIQSLQFAAAKALGWAARPYSVEGAIAFTLSWHECDADVGLLRQSILSVDRECPWKDSDLFTGEQAPSIKFLGEGRPVVNNYSPPEKTYWFTIIPGIDTLGKGQLQAYERYLGTLAAKLTERKPSRIEKIWCVMRTCRVIQQAA